MTNQMSGNTLKRYIADRKTCLKYKGRRVADAIYNALVLRYSDCRELLAKDLERLAQEIGLMEARK